MSEPKRTVKSKGKLEESRTQRRLLRQLLHGPCRTVAGESGIEVIGSETRVYPEALLREARSLGLVAWTGATIAATASAATHLRRALVETEDAFADQHREVVETQVEVETVRQTARRNLAESPLGAIGRLKDRDGQPFLPQDAVDAGERLLADFNRGQLQPRITASWEPQRRRAGDRR